jgi:hypothetical protein
MTPAIRTEQVKCRFCSKWISKHEAVGAPERGFACHKCIEWHFHALDVLGGAVPHGCQECSTSFEYLAALKESQGQHDIRMYVVPKDGIYQLLCTRCKDAYVRKRADHYGDTSFGNALNLK